MTDWAEYWERRYRHGDIGWTLVPHPLVVEELALMSPEASAGPNTPGRQALDLGAGAGRHALWLARHGWRVTAVDFSASALESTRRQAAAEELEVTTVLADLDSYEPRQDTFGVVLIAYVHTEPPQRAALLARAAKAWLRVDGWSSWGTTSTTWAGDSKARPTRSGCSPRSAFPRSCRICVSNGPRECPTRSPPRRASARLTPP
ncbi:class I SAM-dependent methyltransferase [Streptomyces sp. NPDC023838]|uniref:class I SAM-dependent methyltransferase n=1 Tax=Streptomyces sp. NPDC023838 TaxID=3154325 RepID=UPI0033E705F4